LDELESLKPEFKRRLEKLNESRVQAPLLEENGFNMAMQSPANSSLEWPAINKRYNSSMDFKQVRTDLFFISTVGLLKILYLFSSVPRCLF
jgi:STAM-binding protein